MVWSSGLDEGSMTESGLVEKGSRTLVTLSI